MIQRIDANTDDIVDNVEGAQKELLKYWGRVSGNRWLVAKMFGVLVSVDPCLQRLESRVADCPPQMIFFLLWVLIAG